MKVASFFYLGSRFVSLVENILIHYKEQNRCNHNKIDDTQRQQARPAEFHYLVVFEPWDGPSHPDEEENEECGFTCKDSYIQNAFG